MIYIAMIWDMPKCFDFLKNIFIDLYYVRVWTQNLRQSRKSSHNSSTNIRCLKTDFFKWDCPSISQKHDFAEEIFLFQILLS